MSRILVALGRLAAAWTVAACAWAPLVHAADGSAVARELVVLADFDIAPDGHVAKVAMASPDLAPEIGKLVVDAASQWRFEPVLVDGVAAPVRTRAAIKLRAEPVADGYMLGVQGIGFGSRASAISMQPPPQYPREAMRAGVDAAVQLYVEFGPDGRVADARIISTAIGARGRPGGRPRELAAYAALFEAAAKQAAVQWRFDVSPEIAGTPQSSGLWIPITFHASGHRLITVPGRSEVTQEILDRVASTPRAGSEPIALESRVRLKQDVVGTTL